MFHYYLVLGVRNLMRNPVLTTLMVLTLAVGVAASIATSAPSANGAICCTTGPSTGGGSASRYAVGGHWGTCSPGPIRLSGTRCESPLDAVDR